VSKEKPLSTDHARNVESPFLDQEPFVRGGDPKSERRAAALAAESPFQSAFEEGWGSVDLPETEGPESESFSEGPFSEAETGVINGDNRVRVTPTVGLPWRWICKVEVKRNNAQPNGGTGVLVSNRHVLTAAHVVHEASRNMQNFSIRVIPALDYGDEPFDSYAVTAKPKLPSNYDPDSANSLDWDYALLKLDTAVGKKTFEKLKGNPLCFWGSQDCGANSVFARHDPKTLNGKPALTAGYPRSAGAKKLMCAAGMLHSATRLRRTMGITADTTKGQSGSPVWIVENGKLHLVGIAAGAGERTNTVVRVTRELVRQLRAWITEDGETPSMIEAEEASELSFSPLPDPQAEYETLAAASAEPLYQEAEPVSPSEAEDHEPPAAGWSPSGKQAEEPEARSAGWEFESERTTGDDGEADTHEVRLEENEFRVDRLPEKARAPFLKTDSAAWLEAIDAASGAGFKNPSDLADLIFFMQHRDRVVGGVGKPIDKRDPDFFKLRAEWNLYRTIASRRLNPSTECSVFLPARPSSNYEQYVAERTTGRITLFINGRTSGTNKTEAFESMQLTVESLGPNDTVYLAAFQVNPTKLTGPTSAGVTTWADLFVSKAKQGVKIRIIMTDIPEFGPTSWKSDLSNLNAAIGQLPVSARDNLKYIVSMHPAQLRFKAVGLTKQGPIVKVVPADGLLAHVATHHQKFMVAKKSGMTIAYCGGLDISPQRTPQGWPDNKLQPAGLVWHDTHVKLEGLIARDLEREFVLRWNRGKDKSTAAKLLDWKPFEKLAEAPLGSADREAAKNTHKLQMLRTVSAGATTPDIRRDDVWQGYFRLIGCATRFLFMENQYFHEPAMADAIVKQAEAQPDLIIIIVVAFEIDDPTNQLTEHGRALQNEFFKRLFEIPANRRRVYTMFGRLVHSKLILVDDQALSVGSTNADPRDFFMDTQLNVMLDDSQAVTGFRHQLWSHDLGVSEAHVAGWAVSDFIAQWDLVAKANELLKTTPEKMKGEGVIPFDPTTVKGKLSTIPDILTELDGGKVGEPENSEEAGESEDQWAEAEADNYGGDVGFEHPGVSEFQAEPAEQEPEALEVREDRDAGEDETPVIIQHDVPKTSTRVVAVGERVELDLNDIAFAQDAENIKWTIPGTVVRSYNGTGTIAELFKLTEPDLQKPRISFFWVDAADGRKVRVTFRTMFGGWGQAVFDFDVKGPTLSEFTGTTDVTDIKKTKRGIMTMKMSIHWRWTIAMPATHAGHVKDVQTLVQDRSKIMLRKPGGKDTRKLAYRHPTKKDPHVQLDGADNGEPAYSGDKLYQRTFKAGESHSHYPADIPSHGLDSLDKMISVNDQFTYYIMFKPVLPKDPVTGKDRLASDAIWVPVAKATWFWNATATRRDKTWKLVQPKPKMEPSITMATVDFPMYETNVEKNEWQEVSP
jgi:phosphatidylserine/phosphatidylglycerophosphate/cardiolipin synthase-like enzyme/V8-like Glu-specific endopeptidase